MQIKAAGIPGQMEIPATSVNGQNIVVSWQVPYENSDFVSAYRAYAAAKDGSFHQLEECNVSGSPPATSCSVEMTKLQESPFSLVQDDIVRVRMQASNTNDWSEMSESNVSGGRIQVKPYEMQPPTRGGFTSTSQLEVVW